MKNTKELSGEVFASAIDYLPRLMDGLRLAVEHFKQEHDQEGYLILRDASEGLTWFNQVFIGLPVIIPQGENIEDIKDNWAAYLEALTNTLAAIEKRDTPTICQALENEIIPFVRVVYERINSLQTNAQFDQ